ncbi:hypothetical protein COCC4DRAFT_57199 [Bipolaris maydis ATCC 48331]|uniref:Uncharacterized protein n=2 Tax=Cochliobolus heterostrophus TaxID=5016 RepID=M2UVC4_COCH5|nr:uncharacterized protein COCC4DRAFT_57199 [Bipolaris maydis ATCC 48331]EMD88317.1 hypothetical protein COCHEDRAFT_1159483 [Bipolaris maydis C5]KAJ5059154.1 hypothetical protein J3E74DRAFT_218455 [Bipolaris maydis]EMD91783.1 hypothetical protein COCHEDRAFT_1102301 [Bipolaris maydis C5]ENI08459.1 hypothetical protein COCC4DRAFT_57199 [Bipolaris maydis ATCC 48331]KAJ6202734.1 hypothetical protein J3E72DRAFT_177859 [Bipolaris maydis]
MNPGKLPMRPQSRPVCQLCDYILRQPGSRRAFRFTSAVKAPATRRQTAPSSSLVNRAHVRSITTTARKAAPAAERADDESYQTSERIATLRANLAAVEARIKEIYDSPKVEPETKVLEALEGLTEIAQNAIAIRSRQPLQTKGPIRQSSAGAILSGLGSDDAEKTEKKIRSKQLGLDALPSPSYLSKLAEDLIKHEKVFLSPNVLALYIHLQRLLARPKTIPEALYLYANKPVPVEGSSPPKFSRPSPKAAKQAIPADLADEALTAAIDAKDLALALDVVDHTYRAPAWRRHRMVTKLGLPGVIAGMTPLALYMIAQELSIYSGFIDPWTFKLYAFAGLSTYVMCTGTLGFVALTTYNDHHDRVVWRPGVPLLDRYLREDERAALDRIACAWGFKEEWRRGDEEGEEWEGLRQWILLRGMVLDKPDLMPGQFSAFTPTMSADAAPISFTRFSKALEDLSVESLYAKYSELTNQLMHLESSNQQLEEFAREHDDKDCYEALLENKQVIKRFEERKEAIKHEVQDVRGLPWRPKEDEGKTNGSAPAATNGAAREEGTNGTAAQEEGDDGVYL